jgi:hypothetical protein
VSRLAPDSRSATAAAEIAAPAVALAEDRAPVAAAVAAMPVVTEAPEAGAVQLPAETVVVAALPVAAVAPEPEPEPAAAEPAVEPVVAGALAVAQISEEPPAVGAEVAPAGEIVEEVIAPAPEELAAETLDSQPAAVLSPQQEVSALQAQLAALQAQLDELGEPLPDMEELPAIIEDEGPAPGATEELTLPGADEAAQVAAEMAALRMESQPEAL